MAENLSLKTTLNGERMRSKGMLRFIFEVGFIRFAIPLTVLDKIITYVIKYGLTSANIGEFFTERNILNFLIETFAAGITFGLILWVWGKKENYSKLKG